MSLMRRTGYRPLILLVALAALPPAATGQETPATALTAVGFDQNLDAQLPLGLPFRDESGRTLPLAAYFGTRPVILAMVYYRCPMLCGEELKGLARSLKPLKLSVGQGFDVVVVSIDPTEGPDLASGKKATFVERYDRPGTEDGWHFLTGDESSIAPLAKAVGFRYSYNPTTKLYAHAAGIAIATPTGKISRYIFGIDFPSKDLQFALIAASGGKIGSPVARLLLFCYDYDPTTGKYTFAIMRVLQVLGTGTALILGAYVAINLLRDRSRAARRPSPNPSAP